MLFISPFSNASPQASAISHLFVGLLIVSALVVGLIAALVGYIAVRFRHRSGDQVPAQTSENRLLEIIWTAIPTAILIVVMIFTLRTMHAVMPPPGNRHPDVVVTAHQWWWEFQYPATGALTANELHLALGKRTLLQVDSADVIHSFWCPQLGPKIDAIPGHPNFLWLTPERPGNYYGTCGEYCGAAHAWMHFRVIVQSPAQLAQWEHHLLEVPKPPTGGEAAKGATLFREMTCSNCHTIAGTPAHGTTGPNLTHVGGRLTLAAAVMPNTPKNMARWLTNPQKVKPGNYMPNMRLSAPDIKALTAYLESLK